jgi:hypothetical protein
VEWFGVDGRETEEAGTVPTQQRGSVTFEPPFAGGPSVLYLRAA